MRGDGWLFLLTRQSRNHSRCSASVIAACRRRASGFSCGLCANVLKEIPPGPPLSKGGTTARFHAAQCAAGVDMGKAQVRESRIPKSSFITM